MGHESEIQFSENVEQTKKVGSPQHVLRLSNTGDRYGAPEQDIVNLTCTLECSYPALGTRAPSCIQRKDF